MTDDDLQAWWPELGITVKALRAIGESSVAERLVDAVRAGATSSEILGLLRLVLDAHCRLRARLDDPARQAWDAVVAAACRTCPLARIRHWLARWS